MYMPVKLASVVIRRNGSITAGRRGDSNPGRRRRASGTQIQVGGTSRKMTHVDADDQKVTSGRHPEAPAVAITVCPVRVATLKSGVKSERRRHCSGSRIMTPPPPANAVFTVPEGNRGLLPTRGVKKTFRRAGHSRRRLTRTDILTAWARGLLALVPREYHADYLSRPGGWSVVRVDGFTLVTPPSHHSHENGLGLPSRPEGGDD